ncbi:ArsA family ATPase [Caldiplasma sukawensis]
MTKVLLYTGKGGVGKTSISAATAMVCSQRGLKTLVISTDPAHSLSDSFDTEIGPKVKKIGENLYAQEISVTSAISEYWETLKKYLVSLIRSQGVSNIEAEEIATLPGFDEASQLLFIRKYYDEGEYDVIIMDTAPTGESLKLLSFPESFSWYMERIFPISRRTAKLVRPLVKPFVGVPLPEDEVFKSIEDLYRQMREVRNILSDPEITRIRLVCNPDRMSFNETKRAFTYLLMYGYSVDAVIVNKIFSEETGYYPEWVSSQKKIMKEIDDAFSDLKILKVRLQDEEPTGKEKLKILGNYVYGNLQPEQKFVEGKPPVEFEKNDEKYYIKIRAPYAEKSKLNLYNRGGEIIIEIDNWRRVFFLPQSMEQMRPGNAEFNNGYLIIEMV